MICKQRTGEICGL